VGLPGTQSLERLRRRGATYHLHFAEGGKKGSYEPVLEQLLSGKYTCKNTEHRCDGNIRRRR
jgi:hypothetical protein